MRIDVNMLADQGYTVTTSKNDDGGKVIEITPEHHEPLDSLRRVAEELQRRGFSCREAENLTDTFADQAHVEEICNVLRRA